MKTAVEFWSHVDQSGECWRWLACIHVHGYGSLKWAGRTQPAHRVAYALVNGPIPEGLTLDHLCRNRACVNPAHLEPVTPRENVLRGEGTAATNARKTHCPNGHPYDRIKPYGRTCSSCQNERIKLWRRRKRLRLGIAVALADAKRTLGMAAS